LAAGYQLVFRQEIACTLVCTISAQIVGRAHVNGTNAGCVLDLQFPSQFRFI
jgi:hypothetical protein